MLRKWLIVVLTVTCVVLEQAFVQSQARGRHRNEGRRNRPQQHFKKTGAGFFQSRSNRPIGGRNKASASWSSSTFNLDINAWWNTALQGNRRKVTSGVFNPYIEILSSNDDMVWSRRYGWHSLSNEDEYHTITVIEEVTTNVTESDEDSRTEGSATTPAPDVVRQWKGMGSFTGDMKLHCLQNRVSGECTTGIVQVYHKELDRWGTICGDAWHSRDADVVCQYLQFEEGRALKIGPAKTPVAIRRLSKFLKNINCDGNEWALTDCSGDKLTTNYSCRSNKLAGVKCIGQMTDGRNRICQKAETKCQDGDRCIDPEYICDGMADCPWGTDEIGCTGDNCKKSEYWCGPRGGGCISNEYLCDGETDCIDGSDERDCEQFLDLFEKTSNSRMKTKRYEVQWQPITPYLCAQKCNEETTFVCTSFDYFEKTRLCLLFSPSSPKRLRRKKKWDHYERQGVEDCVSMNKHRCDDGSCILNEEVCDFKNDCPSGEDEQECEPMKLRLRGGSLRWEGRVEAAKGTKFGLICDTHWTLNEANVVCRQLNFSRGALQALKGGAFDRSGRRYVLDNVHCRGDEAVLEDCRHDGWSKINCRMDHEAGVVCINDDVQTTTTIPETSSTTSTTTTTTTRRPEASSSTTTSSTTTTTTTTTPTTTTTVETTTLSPFAACGEKPPTRPFFPMARIVGGRGVEANEWPWQVGIWLLQAYKCGGSLIHPCWVLTAAHCFMRKYRLSDYTVRLGDHLTQHNDNTEQYMKIARLIEHDYNHTTKENDIALLQIVSESGECATLTAAVRTVCLPKSRKQFKPPQNCTVTGWGRLSASDIFSYAYILQEATVPLIAPKRCAKQSEYGELKNTMFCAGYMKGGVDSCQGDSGGPLSCQDVEDDRYYVWGIVSWGHGCARPKAPGVYASVAVFLDWIRENTGLDDL